MDAGKAFDKIQHPYMIKKKNLSAKWEQREQIHCQHHTQQARTTLVPLRIGNNTGMSVFTSLIQHITGSPRHSNHTRRN